MPKVKPAKASEGTASRGGGVDTDPADVAPPTSSNRRTTLIAVPNFVKIRYSDEWRTLAKDMGVVVAICLVLTIAIISCMVLPNQYSMTLDKPQHSGGIRGTSYRMEYHPFPLREIWLIQIPRTLSIPLIMFFCSQFILEVREICIIDMRFHRTV